MLQQKYKNPSSAIASYDYTDIANGSGYVVFYCGETSKNGGNEYILSSNVFYSQNITTSNSQTQASLTKIIDKDYDLVINNPRILNGKAVIRVNLGIKVNGSLAGGTATLYVIPKIRKWDGSTETEIASTTSETLSQTVPSSTNYTFSKSFTVQVPVTTYALKGGETLRLTIEVYEAYDEAGKSVTVYLAQDPQNRADDNSIIPAAGSTQLKADIPFRIDV